MTIKYPKGETVWVTYINRNHGPVCILTSKSTRDYYYLYDVEEDGSLKRLGRARTPTELEKKYSVHEKMARA